MVDKDIRIAGNRSRNIYNPIFHMGTSRITTRLKENIIISREAITEVIWIAKLPTVNPKIMALLRIFLYTV